MYTFACRFGVHINPLTPRSDWYVNSPNILSICTLSSRHIMRISTTSPGGGGGYSSILVTGMCE